jgi:hypothetical protein
LGPVPPCKEEAMLQPGKDEEVLDRPAEVASAIAQQDLQMGRESIPDRLSRERRSQLRVKRQVAVDRGVVASNGQPPS